MTKHNHCILIDNLRLSVPAIGTHEEIEAYYLAVGSLALYAQILPETGHRIDQIHLEPDGWFVVFSYPFENTRPIHLDDFWRTRINPDFVVAYS